MSHAVVSEKNRCDDPLLGAENNNYLVTVSVLKTMLKLILTTCSAFSEIAKQGCILYRAAVHLITNVSLMSFFSTAPLKFR